MINNHKENGSNNLNPEESSTYKIEESSNFLMINKTIDESAGSYFKNLREALIMKRESLYMGYVKIQEMKYMGIMTKYQTRLLLME